MLVLAKSNSQHQEAAACTSLTCWNLRKLGGGSLECQQQDMNNGHRKCGYRRNSRTISKLCTNYLFTCGYICTPFESVVFTTDLNRCKCMILVSMHGLTGTGSRFPTYSKGELCCEGHQCQSLSTVLTAAEMEKIYSNLFSHAVKLRSLTESSSKWETSIIGTVKPGMCSEFSLLNC